MVSKPPIQGTSLKGSRDINIVCVSIENDSDDCVIENQRCRKEVLNACFKSAADEHGYGVNFVEKAEHGAEKERLILAITITASKDH